MSADLVDAPRVGPWPMQCGRYDGPRSVHQTWNGQPVRLMWPPLWIMLGFSGDWAHSPI